MNEEKKQPETKPVLPLTWRDGAIPLLAIAMTVMYYESFDWTYLVDHGFPGLGILALVAVHFAAVLIVLGRKAKFTPSGIFCMAASLALGLSCTLYAAEAFVLLNCFVILLVAAMATFSLSGHTLCSRARSVPDAVMLTIVALFSKLGRPFRALGQAGRSSKGDLGRVMLSLVIAIPVLAVVLALLASADQVFGSLVVNIRLPDGDWGLQLYRVIRTLIMALFVASALYFICEDRPQAPAAKPEKDRQPLPFLVVTVLLDIVYIIFCVIQIRFLFGGAEAAAMAGGWAQYARSGFFQLVGVAAINLGLCMLGADGKRFAARGGMALRAAYGLLLALTAVILGSAFRRMQLYILAYGMTRLRLTTLWAMAAIAVGILTAAWKLYRPTFAFFPVAAGFALGMWCLMCLAGPGRMVADYNVDQYLAGHLEEVDTFYICYDLSADGLPALRRLVASEDVDESVREDAARHIRHVENDMEYYAPWTRWTLSRAQAQKPTDSTVVFQTGTLQADTGYRTIVWDDRVYVPYGTLAAKHYTTSLGDCLGHVSGDEDDLIYALKGESPEQYLVEYLRTSLMDVPLVYRALDTKGQEAPDTVLPLQYDDIWEE